MFCCTTAGHARREVHERPDLADLARVDPSHLGDFEFAGYNCFWGHPKSLVFLRGKGSLFEKCVDFFPGTLFSEGRSWSWLKKSWLSWFLLLQTKNPTSSSTTFLRKRTCDEPQLINICSSSPLRMARFADLFCPRVWGSQN